MNKKINYNKIKRINYKEYKDQFNYLYNRLDNNNKFKVDQIKKHYNFNVYLNINNIAICCLSRIKYNTIELKSLISIKKGYGSLLLQYVIKNYSKDYNIILDSFESNNKFYLKNNFIPYKKDQYNKKYDPLSLNKNKESVIYYKYKGDAI